MGAHHMKHRSLEGKDQGCWIFGKGNFHHFRIIAELTVNIPQRLWLSTDSLQHSLPAVYKLRCHGVLLDSGLNNLRLRTQGVGSEFQRLAILLHGRHNYLFILGEFWVGGHAFLGHELQGQPILRHRRHDYLLGHPRIRGAQGQAILLDALLHELPVPEEVRAHEPDVARVRLHGHAGYGMVPTDRPPSEAEHLGTTGDGDAGNVQVILTCMRGVPEGAWQAHRHHHQLLVGFQRL
mmetsp:Transcript_50757/g.121290  ORF Transcript_50757/g.121290 Transcript_50757/m.121290 type:complete len:236 (+) Transcript_50757:308-1015(+)